jgi:GxxExxY protein
LAKQGLKFERQKPIIIYYDDKPIGDHRLDFLVESRIILELKACKEIDDVHLAISKSYLRATKVFLALITNFAQPKLQIRRVVLTV